MIGAAIVGFIVAYIIMPDKPTRLEAAVYPSIGLVVGFFASYLLILAFTCVAAPVRQRNEARQRVRELEQAMEKKTAGVEVIASYPVLHTETGVAPYGDYILVPGLNIINHMDRDLACHLTLEVKIEEGKFLLDLETSEIVNTPSSLPSGLRGNKQLGDPIRIGHDSLEVGFAAFNIEILPPDSIDKDWSKVELLNLVVDDAVSHYQLAEHEVWPWMWPSVFERAAGEQ